MKPDLYEHRSLMRSATEKYRGRGAICPDCYLPPGAHRPNGGQRCEQELPSAMAAARMLDQTRRNQ